MISYRRISILLMLIFISSCEDNERNAGKVLDEVLESYSDSLNYFDIDCINFFSKAFREVNVLDETIELKEACVFYPKSGMVNGINDSDFLLAFYAANDTLSVYQTYMYDTYHHHFIPISLDEKKIELDTLYILELYFGDPIICGEKKIRGSIYKEANKNGFFKRMD